MKDFLLILFLYLVLVGCSDRPATLFTELKSYETGIEFNNVNVENEAINIFTYEYLYNGGGVATGDVNNDGLADIYFSSNNLENRLYLNKGNLRFEDITNRSGTGCRKGWKTGVTMVDIDGDGWLDIYVCRSADGNPENRRNSLLINNHDLTFTDKARDYNLDDDSYSTQALFIDYDRDDDLDLFLLNHSLLSISNSFDVSSFNQKIRTPFVGNKLLRNNEGHFVDVSDELGIYGPSSNYGLGVTASDFNNDGWPDIYASNDYVDKDKLYLNKNGKSFDVATDSLFTHVSQFSMGVDAGDINNDGLIDLITLDMLPEDNKRQKNLFAPDRYDVLMRSVKSGYYYQYMRNMVQLNNGDGTFSEIGQLAGLSNTDWSWAVLLADYDNDGYQDAFISNGYKRDFTNVDFLKYRADQELKAMSGNKDRYSEMIKHIPQNLLHNYIFKNNGDLTFSNKVQDWGFEAKALTNGAAFSDLDNDGDLDLVLNNMDSESVIMRNNSQQKAPVNFLKLKLKGQGMNTFGIGSKVQIFHGDTTQTRYAVVNKGFQSSVDPILQFGLGISANVDSLLVEWPNGKVNKYINIPSNKLISVEQSNAEIGAVTLKNSPVFFLEQKLLEHKHVENDYVDFKTQPLLPRMYSTQGPAMASADVNGDNLTDVYVGGAKGYSGKLYLKQNTGKYIAKMVPSFNDDLDSEDIDAVFFDADSDADADLYVVSGGYEFQLNDKQLKDRLYLNDGKGSFTKNNTSLPDTHISGSCVRPADIDHDGDLDLFVGGRLTPGRYPEPASSQILINTDKGIFKDGTDAWAPFFKNFGMVTDASWVDVDNNGRLDLIVVGEWMPIKIYINENEKLIDRTLDFLPDSPTGWWNCIEPIDVDQDGDIDFVVGNMGLNNQMRPTKQAPVTLNYLDIDNNGSIDPLLSYYIQGKSFPYANRDELTDQIPALKKLFIDYESYSDVTIETILTPDQLKNSKMLSATMFESILLLNKNKSFSVKHLPAQAQFAPVFAVKSIDANHDGNLDLIMAGNLTATRVRTGKYAASYGSLFWGDGRGGFKYAPQLTSGLHIRGDVRKIIIDGHQVHFGISNGYVMSYVNQ